MKDVLKTQMKQQEEKREIERQIKELKFEKERLEKKIKMTKPIIKPLEGLNEEAEYNLILKEYGLDVEKVKYLLEDYNQDARELFEDNRMTFIKGFKIKKAMKREQKNCEEINKILEGKKEITHDFIKFLLNDSLKNFKEEPKSNDQNYEFKIEDFKEELDKLVSKYRVKYGSCTSTYTESKLDTWEDIKNDFIEHPAMCYYSDKSIVFKNEYNWNKLKYAKGTYLVQISKYKKRKELGLDIRCLDLNGAITNSIEATATHEYCHILDCSSRFAISTDDRIIKIHNEQKERILDELGYYAYFGQNKPKEGIDIVDEYATRELCAKAFEYNVFDRENRPKLANEVIDIIEEILESRKSM